MFKQKAYSDLGDISMNIQTQHNFYNVVRLEYLLFIIISLFLEGNIMKTGFEGHLYMFTGISTSINFFIYVKINLPVYNTTISISYQG